MTLTNTFGRMPLERIWVHRAERQRTDLDLERGGFIASIAQRGVIMPVVLEEVPDSRGYHVLYAGERRYAASLELGLPDIPFRFARSPSESEVQIIELEENIKRLDLPWQDVCQAVVRLHALLRADNSSHTLEATGEALGWSDGTAVSRYLFINESWHDEAVRACGTMGEAYNLLLRRAKRAQAAKLDEVLGGAATDEESEDGRTTVGNSDDVIFNLHISGNNVGENTRSPQQDQAQPRHNSSQQLPVIHADFLAWAPTYSGSKFNLVHCDFPYGIKFGESTHKSGSNALHREEGERYEDGEEHYATLLACLAEHFNRFASESCHIMFWYSNRAEVEVATRAALLRIPGLSLFRFPLIWHKSDNAGFLTPGTPRHVYETCLVGVRGDRPIVKYVSDAYSAPSDNSLHMSAKPEPMLRYFMGLLVDEHTRLLDPTAGSGSALRAAESLKAQYVLGLETNEEMVQVANKALLDARAKRAAEGVGK